VDSALYAELVTTSATAVRPELRGFLDVMRYWKWKKGREGAKGGAIKEKQAEHEIAKGELKKGIRKNENNNRKE
jgi:hypothetical protein